MNELSLFSGAGGGLLGTHLLGWKHIGYVEFNDYCQRVIRARINDGILDNAPIFTDVCQFVQSGAAQQYRGFADVVTAGFPCQPFSVAGKRAGVDDERNMWPATIECIRLVRPRYALLENVPGILASGYFGTILGDLAAAGYDARWRVLSATEMGAPHKRDRLWIVAYAASKSKREPADQTNAVTTSRKTRHESGDGSQYVSYTNGYRCGNGKNQQECQQGSYRTSNPSNDGKKEFMENAQQPTNRPQEISSEINRTHATRPTGGISRPSWWEVEPRLDRVADGVANRVDRLKAIGNGQVSAVAAQAWHLLTTGI